MVSILQKSADFPNIMFYHIIKVSKTKTSIFENIEGEMKKTKNEFK